MKTIATGRKIILDPKQKLAAELVFGPELSASIISAAQTQVKALADAAADLKATVDDFDSRLTAYEMLKGVDLTAKFYQSNGKPADDLAGRLFGGAK